MCKISRTLSIPSGLQNSQLDDFAIELIDLWKTRQMRGSCLVSYLYTMPVGFLLLEEGEKTTIRGLWVDPTFRKQGIGESLIQESIKLCANSVLHVNANESAVGFYEKLGFQRGERRKDFPDQIRMTYARVGKDAEVV